MTTTIVGEVREGESTLDKGEKFDLRWTETINYLVESDTAETTREEVIFDTPGLPIVGISQTSSGAICTNVSAQRNVDNAIYWNVTCRYENVPAEQEQDENNPSTDPTTWKPKYSFSFETVEYADDFDQDNQHVANSMGTPFDAPLMFKRTITCFDFVQFEDAHQTAREIADRHNTVNASQWEGFPKYTLLLQVKSAEIGTYGRVRGWKVSYQLKYKPDDWRLRVADIGPEYIDGAGFIVAFKDADGNLRIGNLNGAGGATGNDGRDPPEELLFHLYERSSFSFLRIQLQ